MSSVRLNNGLTVVLDGDNRPGLAAVGLAIAVGSGADPTGRRGLAHVVEHLMFRRAEDRPQDTYTATVEGLGGTCNAVTYRDHTLFHSAFPADALDRMLTLEAERLQRLEVTDSALGEEKPVVAREIRGIMARTNGGFP